MKNWDDLKIERGKVSRNSEPRITLYMTKNKNINMYLTSGFLRHIEEEYVILGWSEKNNVIVLFFTEEWEKRTRKISKQKTSISISIQSFVNICNLDKNQLIGSYVPEYEKIFEDKCGWVIYLDKKINTSIV